MAGILKTMRFSRSISIQEYADFDPDISIALEYTGVPVNFTTLPQAFPVDVDHIPTANVPPKLNVLNDLSLPVVEPIRRSKFRITHEITRPRVTNTSNNLGVSSNGFEGNKGLKGEVGNLDDEIDSSGTLGFTDSQDHSHDLSESSDILETPFECQEIEGFPNPSSVTHQGLSLDICCVEEEASDGEVLECRSKKKPVVAFCNHDTTTDYTYEEEESEVYDDSVVIERPVAEKPAKSGVCYNCHRGNRLTEKEACIVCDAKYCKHCILRVMGSMPEGRKCVACIGYPIDESKRHKLGKSSRLIKGLLSKFQLERVMEDEVSCASNHLQLRSHHIFVNGRRLSMEELIMLQNCSNPPRNLEPGNYWYDKVAGFWGKEGEKPCQIITANLSFRASIRRDASNGDTNIIINDREITKTEKLMLKIAGVPCGGNPCYWVHADGAYQEVGMKHEKGNIWSRRRTKLMCTLLSLPFPESPNHAVDEGSIGENDQRALRKILLVGNDGAGTSTIYKQARLLFDHPFSEEEKQNIKSMIQCNLYGYLGRLLEGREQFEEEILSRKRHSNEEPGPSANPHEIQDKTEYTIGQRLKNFSDWLINILVSGNLDIIFPAATRKYAPFIEELWKDAAIQAAYSRRRELDLPIVASYFLDKAVEIAKVDYEPSDIDILYAEGFSFVNGLVSMDFSCTQTSQDSIKDPTKLKVSPTPYQLVRLSAKNLGANCKWSEMFEDFGVVLFCIPLTDYDEYEVSSSGILTNKMMETKKLFESMITHPTFDETNFLLILNKFDLLEEKIEHSPLTCCEWFKDFNPVLSHHHKNRRNQNNLAPLAERAFHYIAVQFKRLYKSLTGKKLYVCPVTALESDSVDSALKYAREIMLWEEDKLSFSMNESSSESIDIDQL